MRRKGVLLLVLLAVVLSALVLSVAACGGEEATTVSAAAGGITDAKTYTDSTYGFNFKYPGAWKIDDGTTTDATAGASSTGSVGAFDPDGAKAEDIFIDLMVVSTYKLNQAISDSDIPALKSELEGVLSDLESQATDAKIVTPLAETTAAGLKGYSVTYTFTKGGVPATSQLYFLFKGDMEYQLITQAATENWAKNQATFSAMVASFTAK